MHFDQPIDNLLCSLPSDTQVFAERLPAGVAPTRYGTPVAGKAVDDIAHHVLTDGQAEFLSHCMPDGRVSTLVVLKSHPPLGGRGDLLLDFVEGPLKIRHRKVSK